VGKPRRIRQTEIQSDQSKTVPHEKQDIEVGTHQIGSSNAWGYAAKSHLKKLQAVESIALRTAVDASWYVKNVDIQ